MAITLTNNAEGQTSGTTVTVGNSGGNSGNAFTGVAVGTGVAVTFDNGRAAHGVNAYKIVTPVTAATLTMQWNQTVITPGAGTSYARQYIYLTANPAATLYVAEMTTSAGSRCARLGITTAGKLRMDRQDGQVVTTSTASVPLNQWFRVEFMVVSSATVGQTELKLFSTADSTTPTETNTSAANVPTFGGNIQRLTSGVLVAVSSQTLWLDDIGFSDTAYLGPAGITGTAAQAAPSATQSASGTVTVPDFTGTAASTAPSATQAATGAATVPAYTGTAASTAPSATQTAAGATTVPDFTGTAAQTAPTATQAAIGATVPPDFTGTATSTAPAATQTAVGTSTVPAFAGTAVSLAPSAQQTATGTVAAPAVAFTGTAASVAPPATQTATGTSDVPHYTGTAATSAPSSTQQATGTTTVPAFTGTAASVAPAATQAAGGYVFTGLEITPDERILHVRAEPRTATVAAENRVVIVAADTRTIRVQAEPRTVTVPADDRVLEVV